jgi:hypothetical protein
MEKFPYEDEFLALKGELSFLSHAVENSFASLAKDSLEESDADSLSYGACLCFRHVLERVERLEQHAITDFL